ncbi:hypothetical protein [Paraburkholderia sp. GAS348]|uniref:hypothetical protein n=1 Tax=Paraburkholderia sp. GAS348 TaxID=3035132 RepID=UPI003D1C946D
MEVCDLRFDIEIAVEEAIEMKNHVHTDPDKSIIPPLRALAAFRDSDAAHYLLRHPVHAASASIE